MTVSRLLAFFSSLYVLWDLNTGKSHRSNSTTHSVIAAKTLINQSYNAMVVHSGDAIAT
ncbi:protein of unknown function (plasmid) [Citrobacter freundii]|nr:protein of unknown function [Citrobacter freundii]